MKKEMINIILVLVIISIASVITILVINYYRFMSSENPSNICQTPAGYTDEQWKTHMSHHPDRYAQCLTTMNQ